MNFYIIGKKETNKGRETTEAEILVDWDRTRVGEE